MEKLIGFFNGQDDELRDVAGLGIGFLLVKPMISNIL